MAWKKMFPAALAAAFLALVSLTSAWAHCDRMDGPVVKAAQRALESGNINLVLIWVQKKDEGEVRAAFERARAVRKLSPDAREMADRWFFETLVRVHRAGEGAPFTGIKPAGSEMDPVVRVADRAIEDASPVQLLILLNNRIEDGVQSQFKQVMVRKNFAPDDVEAGRQFVKAYVSFVHYVEALHALAILRGMEQHREAAVTETHD